MDFRTLSSFFAVYDTRHFSQAARQQGLSQPALSRQIQGLEKELGYPLFVRGRQGVATTPKGENFYQKMAPLFTHMKNQYEELCDDCETLKGDFWLATYAELGLSLINPMIGELQGLYPELRFHLRFLKTEDIFAQVKSGAADMGIFNPREKDHNMLTFELAKETHVLVTGCPQAAQSFPLEKNHFLAYSKNDLSMGRMIKNQRQLHGKFSPQIIYTVNSLSAIIDALEGQSLFAVLPTHRIRHDLANGRLHAVPGSALSSQLYLAQMDEFRTEHRSKVLRKFFIQRFREIEAQSAKDSLF